MTLNQMFGQLDEALNINSDDSVFEYTYYYDLIIQSRSVGLRNEYSRLRSIHPSLIQPLCIEFELVDANTCCNGDLTGCLVLKSKEEIPDTIELHQKDGILSVKPASLFGKDINYIPYSRVTSAGNGEFSKKLLYSFLYDKHLYLFSKDTKYKLIDKLVITGIFVDPIAASKVSCDGEHCLNYDSAFPLTEWMWQTLVKPYVIQELQPKQFMPKDEVNNAQDDKTNIATNSNARKK